MKQRASDGIALFLFGVMVTLFFGATTFRYFPTPLELFGDAGAECHQPRINQQKNAPQSQNNPERSTVLKGINTEPQTNDADAEKRINDCLMAKYTASLAAFTKYLVFVTALLAGFGLWQVIISRQTARRQLRAYVFLDPTKEFTFVSKPSTTSTIEVEIHVKNLGATPAHEIIGYSWAHLDVWPLPQTFQFTGPVEGEPSEKFVLPPGAATHYHTGSARPLTAEEMAAVENGDLRVYIFGRIEYKDAFNRPHWTNFCFATTALGKEGFSTAIAKCDRHNDADNK